MGRKGGKWGKEGRGGGGRKGGKGGRGGGGEGGRKREVGGGGEKGEERVRRGQAVVSGQVTPEPLLARPLYATYVRPTTW